VIPLTSQLFPFSTAEICNWAAVVELALSGARVDV
jgi:hypothetical protein